MLVKKNGGNGKKKGKIKTIRTTALTRSALGDLRRLGISQTSVKYHKLKLVSIALKD